MSTWEISKVKVIIIKRVDEDQDQSNRQGSSHNIVRNLISMRWLVQRNSSLTHSLLFFLWEHQIHAENIHVEVKIMSRASILVHNTISWLVWSNTGRMQWKIRIQDLSIWQAEVQNTILNLQWKKIIQDISIWGAEQLLPSWSRRAQAPLTPTQLRLGKQNILRDIII